MSEMQLFTLLLEKININLDQNQINKFMTYYDMLIEKNKVMNLTAITDFKEVLVKHFIDSLSLVQVYNNKDEINLIDMGTGAGFPGIPLKIAFPNWNIVLLDSLNKRVNFLNEVITELELDHIKAIHGRAEEFGKNSKYRETFDLCVSRAVANLTTLSEYCIPYIKVGGYFIPYKSGNIENELKESKNAISVLGGSITNVKYFTLPETDIERSFVVIQKKNKTPGVYPRSGGKPTKEPIK